LGRASIFAIAIICLTVGFAASRTVGRPRSVLAELVLGVAGAFIGELAAQALDIPNAASFLGVAIAASVGALLLLNLLGLFRRRAKP